MDIRLLQTYRGLCEIPSAQLHRFLKLRLQQCSMTALRLPDGGTVLSSGADAAVPYTVLCLPSDAASHAVEVCASILCCMEEINGCVPSGEICVQFSAESGSILLILSDTLPLGSIRITHSNPSDSDLAQHLFAAAASVGKVQTARSKEEYTRIEIGTLEGNERRSLPLIAMEHCADLIRNLLRIRHSV